MEMDHRLLLAPMEDQKTTKKETVVSWLMPQSEWACEWAITSTFLCAMDWLTSSTLRLKVLRAIKTGLAPSLADSGQAVLIAVLWCGMAGAAAAVAVRQPAAAAQCMRTWLLGLLVVTAEGSQLLIGYVVAVAVMFNVYDLVVAFLRGVGVEEEAVSSI